MLFMVPIKDNKSGVNFSHFMFEMLLGGGLLLLLALNKI